MWISGAGTGLRMPGSTRPLACPTCVRIVVAAPVQAVGDWNYLSDDK
jgi:hypothetical protein